MARPGTLSGSVSARIRANAQHLADHPEAVAPRCQGRCPFRCTWNRARKDVLRVHGAQKEPRALRKLSGRGHPLARAYAGLLQLLHEDPPKYGLPVPTPAGTRMILPRSTAPRACLLATQHHHEPALRLLGAASVGPKDPVYADGDGLVCVHEGNPPASVDAAVLQAVKAKLASPALAACEHVPHVPYVELHHRGSGLRVRACPKCTEGNLLASLLRQVATTKPERVAKVRVELPAHPEGLHMDRAWNTPREALRDYLALRTTDAELIAATETAWAQALGVTGQALVILEGQAIRPPYTELLRAHSEPATEVLRAGLAGLKAPLVLTKRSPTHLLPKVWALGARDAAASRLGSVPAELDEAAAVQILQRLGGLEADDRAREGLPAADAVDPRSRPVLDALQILRRQGPDALLKRARDRPHPESAVVYALAAAAGARIEAWMLPQADRDLIDALKPHADRVIQAMGGNDSLEGAMLALAAVAGLEA